MTPIPTVTEAGILQIDLDVSAVIEDVDGAEDYRRLWDGFVDRAAPQLTVDLASAIETSFRAARRPE